MAQYNASRDPVAASGPRTPDTRGPILPDGSKSERNALRYYEDLARKADAQMDRLARETSLKEGSLEDRLGRGGVDRREFLKWAGVMSATLALPSMFAPRVARAATLASRLPVVWVELQSCTGNSEALIRNSNPGVDTIILEMLSLDYSEVLMAAAGDQAEAALDDTIKNHKGKYIAVFEGSVPVGEHARYLTVGAHGETGADRVKRVARDAQLVLNAGSCAAFGNLPVASPNPTTAQGIGAFLAGEGIRTPVINIPGCPMNSISFVGTVLEVVMFGRVPQLDAFSRPQWAYGKRIHDQCERRGHFDAGEFVESFNDVDGLKRGLCLYKVGCKGPFTYNNCGIARFNQGASWPIYAGHGCIGCSEPSFMDALAPFESPVNARKYGIPGGTDVTADQVGKIAVGVAAVAMAAHAGATLLRASSDPKGEDQQ